ncbi:MAG: DUF2244 domain-containing protein [Rhodospirillales bacterium]|nr:DUF2244 domain-containing protein [Rhodospirillales bacterium]
MSNHSLPVPVPTFPGGTSFDAILTPHRSLGPCGFLLLMTAVGLLSFGVGLVFFLAGAWPVLGFFGLDILVIYLTFRVNYRRARQYERVRVSPQQIRIDKVSHHGRRRTFVFKPYFVQVLMEQPVEPDTPLFLASHGQQLRLGSFLYAEERLDFARTLRTALIEASNPPHA